jgi:DNA-binding transcriptional MerR regulator
MIRITELARLTGASVDEVRYLEAKHFIESTRVYLVRRAVRGYEDAQVRKVELTIKYRRQGFTWDMAFQKALKEMENPPLF